jgi:hypothetical protein
MRLNNRLKNGIELCGGKPQGWARGLLNLSLLLTSFVGADMALASGKACSQDAMSALPDQPVALTRVEKAEDGRVRVMWPLRLSAEEGEVVAAPRQLQSGAEFDVLRCLPPGRWVALGHGEVVARNGGLVEGVLDVTGEAVSMDSGVQAELVSTGNLHPTPMVGDLVVVRKKEIAQRNGVSPRVTIPVEKLFGGSADGNAIELTRFGQDSLKRLLLSSFAEARGRLLVEVHARRSGSRTRLREETAQRAKNIEQFLRYEFSLDKEQVVSVGMGSDTYLPGLVDADAPSDFVVLRMLPGKY